MHRYGAILKDFLIALLLCPQVINLIKTMDLARIYRLLKLMQLLSSNVEYTTPELKDRLEISERSIFRYLEVFKDAGYASS